MYTTDIRFGSAFSSKQNEERMDLQNSSSLVSPLNPEGGSLTGLTSSTELRRSEAGSPFSDQEIQQVETRSSTREILQTAYRGSNRGAVVLGLGGGLLGGLHGGPGGSSFGITVGSTVGAYLGGVTGIIEGIQGGAAVPPIDTEEAASLERELEDIAQSNHFLGRVTQVVDHAGHYAAMQSLGVGMVFLLGSMATGIPLSAAFHTAGIYSGAAWAFGLTTGSAHWILRHVQQSEAAVQREVMSSPGDVELRSFSPLERG